MNVHGSRGMGRGTRVLIFLLLTLANVSYAIKRRHGSSMFRRLLADVAQPDYKLYHHMDALLKEVETIVKSHPQSMMIEVRTAKDKEYQAKMQVVTVETAGLTSKHKHKDKARLLLDFGEHSRELISAELGLLLLQTLSDPAAVAKVVGGGERAARLQRILDRTIIKILPLENAGGRGLVEGGALCERKNGRGVDPNRNWPVDWGKKEKDYDPNEENPGREPFSEPEVRMVHELARIFQPHVWLNVHSGMEAMFTPYDHKAEVPPGARDALVILQTIHREVFNNDSNCVVGSGGKSVGYLAHGTATDYMFDVLKVPMPYTWEIYGDFKAAYNDCFRMFNPTTPPEMQATLTKWLKAIFRLLELMPTHPAMPEPVRAVNGPIAATARVAGKVAPLPAKAASVPAPETASTPKTKVAAGKAPAKEVVAAPKEAEEEEDVKASPAKPASTVTTAAATHPTTTTSSATPASSSAHTPLDFVTVMEVPVVVVFERHQMMVNMSIGFIGLFLVIALAARSLQKDVPSGDDER